MKAPKFLFSLLILVAACGAPDRSALPISGTWVNLAWKDVRNKYTNPETPDMTDPALWRAKVAEWDAMGMEYLVLLEVANEGEAFYPSSMMPRAYDYDESPVEAILAEAGARGMKVFLSTGWAWDQDDDIRKPEIQARQQAIMEELAALYGGVEAFYGWYLPVEDCITPVFPKTAVEAVNRLVEKSRALTPTRKTLISPYGMVYGDYDNPEFAENIRNLKVDIIAYQDEVGCVREPYPLPRLRENWKKLRKVHDGTKIAMWANCETFTWEANTNSRTSALIPAAMNRLLAQFRAATEGGAERIVSFMIGGIIENPASSYPLGQPSLSAKAYENYMAWKAGDPYWKAVEAAAGNESPDDPAWTVIEPGLVTIPFHGGPLRFLNCAKAGILPPEHLSLLDAAGNTLWETTLVSWPNNLHDAWVEVVDIPEGHILKWKADHSVYIDYKITPE